MTTGQAIALACILVAVDLVVVGAIVATAVGMLRDFARAFPSKPVAPDAVRKHWQGVSIGMMNLGWSFALAADAEHLHLEPGWILRKAGVPTASVPWGAMKRTTKPGWRWWLGVKAGPHELKVPRWCEPMLEAGEKA